MTEERKYLRKPDSRWAVAYPGDYAPWHVRGWFRWRWRAEWHRRQLAVVTDLPLSVESAETVDQAWEAFNRRWSR